MKKLKQLLQGAVSSAIVALAIQSAPAQMTTFTYQGKLVDGCCPATGLYDLTFKLFDRTGSGNAGQQGSALSKTGVPVTNGLFTVSLDFGSTVFTGEQRWLQVDARTNNASASYVTLLPRTELTPTPYAMQAATVPDNAITRPKIASGQVVKSLNGLADAVSLVAGNNVTLTPNGNNLTINSSGAFSLNGSSAYYNGGNVGIGTSSPGYKVEVAGVSYNNGLAVTGPASPGLTLNSSSGKDWIIFSTGTGVSMAPGGLAFYNSTDDSYRMVIDSAGNVGIGTFAPSSPLHVTRATSSPLLQLTQETAGNWCGLNMANAAGGRWEMDVQQGTTPGLVFYAGSALAFGCSWDGTLQAKVLQINGADVAEPFDISTKEIPKGSVVVIDQDNPGQLKQSDRAYDTRAAGILSGANGVHPGIRLKQEGFNDHGEEVALSGRVFALADASENPIQPGDLLTTSATPGHCMKVTDHGRAQGAIIGKAMSPLKEGKGVVLVLVSLQ